jgi:hypothetical protein
MPRAATRHKSSRKHSAKPKKDATVKKNLNPVHRRGERNYFCPFYCDCLNYAIDKSWDYWVCFDCQHKTSKEINEDIPFTTDVSMPFYDLPSEVYLEME